jgi:hypothetical protein
MAAPRTSRRARSRSTSPSSLTCAATCRGADGPQRYELRADATITDLLAAIGIPADTDLTAALVGELAKRESPLHDGAEVMLLSPMEGGA